MTPRGERQRQGRSGRRSLLGIETLEPDLPCTVSVPNLNSDRPVGLAGLGFGLNVRRLMYQSLIWSAVGGDEAGSLRAPFDAEDLKGTANSLIDGVRRDAELCGNLLGRQVLIDETQAIELPLAQPGDAPLNLVSVFFAAESPFGHGYSPHAITPPRVGCGKGTRIPKPIR